MSFSDKARKALVRVGLTASEIRVYSALLGYRESTAADLSQRAGIPYSKIYDILGTLEEKGWVSSNNSRPTKYLARSPSTGLDTMRQSREDLFDRDQALILHELGPLYERSDASEKPDMLILTGIAVKHKMIDMAESCRSEVMLAIPEAGKGLVPQAMPKLRALHDRGVKLTILATDRMESQHVRSLSQVAAVRVKPDLFGGGIITDRRYVMILLGSERGESSEAVAIWADHVGLAKLATEYFEYLLKDSHTP